MAMLLIPPLLFGTAGYLMEFGFMDSHYPVRRPGADFLALQQQH